jgi:hypothetical protein
MLVAATLVLISSVVAWLVPSTSFPPSANPKLPKIAMKEELIIPVVQFHMIGRAQEDPPLPSFKTCHVYSLPWTMHDPGACLLPLVKPEKK